MSHDDPYLKEAADRVMIRELLSRYAFDLDYLADDGTAWAELFVEHGRVEIPEMSLVAEGRPALRAFAEAHNRLLPGTHHVTTNWVVDLDGDRAKGKSQLNVFLLRPEAIYNCVHAWYEDDYVRIGTRWFFEVRKVHLSPDCQAVLTSGRIGEHWHQALVDFQRFVR